MAEETVIPGQDDAGALPQERTVLAGPTECPVCETENPAGTEWCEECGFLLSSQPEELAAEAAFARLVDVTTGAEYPLREGENTVGRGVCDIVLAGDKSVSRSHAKIVVEPPNLYLEDLGSANGTFLNGESIGAGERVEVGQGDQFRFASTTLELVAPEAAEAERESAREVVGTLEMENGEDGAGPFKVFGGENALGRLPSNDIPLAFDGFVSGRHAKIVASEEGISIEDLDSTNGTELNGQRLTAGVKEPLSDGDEVRVGKTVLKFVAQSAEGEGEADDTEASAQEKEETTSEGA